MATLILLPCNRTCRAITFEDGRVVESVLDDTQDKPKPFRPEYLCGQTFNPEKLAYMSTDKFANPWDMPQTDCLGWLEDDAGDVDVLWGMRLPEDISKQSGRLLFQIANSGKCRLKVTAPGLNDPIERVIPSAPEGQKITLDSGPLAKGDYNVGLTCEEGWGYIAITALLSN